MEEACQQGLQTDQTHFRSVLEGVVSGEPLFSCEVMGVDLCGWELRKNWQRKKKSLEA